MVLDDEDLQEDKTVIRQPFCPSIGKKVFQETQRKVMARCVYKP